MKFAKVNKWKCQLEWLLDNKHLHIEADLGFSCCYLPPPLQTLRNVNRNEYWSLSSSHSIIWCILAHVVPLPRQECIWSNDSRATRHSWRLVGRKGTSHRSHLGLVPKWFSLYVLSCCRLTCRSLHEVINALCSVPEKYTSCLSRLLGNGHTPNTDRITRASFFIRI